MRLWLLLAVLLAVTGVAFQATWRPRGAMRLPGTCAEALVLFCADPSWPDAPRQ